MTCLLSRRDKYYSKQQYIKCYSNKSLLLFHSFLLQHEEIRCFFFVCPQAYVDNRCSKKKKKKKISTLPTYICYFIYLSNGLI